MIPLNILSIMVGITEIAHSIGVSLVCGTFPPLHGLPVILLDSLHAGYIDDQAKTLKTNQLDPFVAFARRAAKKERFMFLSHSSIIPPGYGSTTEVAEFVVAQLGGKPKRTSRKDVLGLDMIDRFDKGAFHMRGYTGEDKPDHCAHIGLMADIVRVHLAPRWKTPKGKR